MTVSLPLAKFWENAAVVERVVPSATVQVHASNLLPLPNGDVLCVWFGGTQEGLDDINIYFSRFSDLDHEWSPPVRLSGDPVRSEQNPALFLAPDEKLWVFWTAQIAGAQDQAEVRARISRDVGASWEDEFTLFTPDADGGVFVRHPPIVGSDGAWVLPVQRCGSIPGRPWSGDADHSAVRISTDDGNTWVEYKIPDSLGMVHMSIAKTNRDGFVAVFRSRYADNVYRSESDHRAQEWTAPTATSLPNNNSSIQMTAWDSEQLVIVYNHSSRVDATERRTSLYDEIEDGVLRPSTSPVGLGANQESIQEDEDERRAFWGTPRAPLSLAVSSDLGVTWDRVTDLVTGDGYCLTNNSRDGLNRELSYPTVAKARDGSLHVAYTHHRSEIRHLHIQQG